MNHNSKIVAVGDLHGDFIWLNDFIKKYQPEIILQCGDFGHWPRQKWYNRFMNDNGGIRTGDTKIYWCDGNHEDHEAISKLKDYQIHPNVFYQPRGSMITLPDGRYVLFAGGADSIDKSAREPGVTWFRNELLTEADLSKFPSANTKIDIVISHTCPMEFYQPGSPILKSMFNISHDISRDSLSWVLKTYKPKQFIAGHWHCYNQGSYDYKDGNYCSWVVLDHSIGSGINWIHI